jgi:hypothetical protein
MTAFGGGHSDLRPKSSRHREERQLSNFRQSSKAEIGPKEEGSHWSSADQLRATDVAVV